ncbi:hypothetical protein C2E23DRAFT_862570 [Lenzites betulinus]|nr:hypothetical protein C2E23DRAFT_862570 [Lenzites betulinus]
MEKRKTTRRRRDRYGFGIGKGLVERRLYWSIVHVAELCQPHLRAHTVEGSATETLSYYMWYLQPAPLEGIRTQAPTIPAKKRMQQHTGIAPFSSPSHVSYTPQPEKPMHDHTGLGSSPWSFAEQLATALPSDAQRRNTSVQRTHGTQVCDVSRIAKLREDAGGRVRDRIPYYLRHTTTVNSLSALHALPPRTAGWIKICRAPSVSTTDISRTGREKLKRTARGGQFAASVIVFSLPLTLAHT